ncbi:MAG: universal stress protein [Terrimicrobiaceae bacterium]
MNTILVCLDTSTSSPRVLAEAKKLAQTLKFSVSLFHVIEPVASYVPVDASMDVIVTSPPLLDDDQLAIAKKRLGDLAVPLQSAGLEVSVDAVIGMAVDEIIERSRTLHADYVVLGSHGHGALFHLFSGSVVNGVLKRSPVPVIVVPVRD